MYMVASVREWGLKGRAYLRIIANELCRSMGEESEG
jgi:hypothetical protein